MANRLNHDLIIKYLNYLYDSIESLYSKRDLNKQDIELYIKEFNAFKNKVNQENRIHSSFKEKLDSIKIEVKRNPRKSRLRIFLEKVFFFINISNISLAMWYDDISMKDRRIIVEDIRNQMSHFMFNINNTKIFI